MPFRVHAPELIFVLVVPLFVLGPKSLSEMSGAVGKTFNALQEGYGIRRW